MLENFEEVLNRARTGAGDAFTQLYQDLSGPVAGYLRSRGVPDVEDLTSEVFIAVFTGVGTFDGSQVQFRSWVFTIAHHRAADHWRRVARQTPSAPYEAADDTRQVESAEGTALAGLGTERVIRLLSQLTDEQREVLALRVVGDLTVEQVAEVTGRTIGAVKALQRRGLRTLRRMIGTEAVPL